uniref:Choline/ethanolamine transporter FLVCR1 n=1 Tax=Elaeophora elaphi TaxID=1147741 RepID=A0A158Q7C9_9BILA
MLCLRVPVFRISKSKKEMEAASAPKTSVEERSAPHSALKSEEIHLYKRRYYILLLFALLSASNSMQWIEYSVIAHIVVEFYSVSYVAVNWTSMIYMLTYILFVLPASWVLDKYGLRISIILGSGGNCIGAWVKMFSAKPDAFWITFLGQAIVGFSQMFILGVPSRLAAVWFGPEQVSTACAIGVFGNQLGIAIGFVLPPVLVHMGAADFIAADLHRLFLISVIANSIIFLLIVFSFPKKPPLPPSLAQLRILEDTSEKNYYHSLKQLMTNPNFVLLFITYGVNVGVFYAVSTVLSQMILIFHPKEQESAGGMIGLLLVLAGMIGSVLCGFILDRFHQFKLTTLIVYLFCAAGMLLFTFLVNVAQMWYIYVSSILLGFFMTGYLPIGFEFASELTFPIAEGTASGLLNASAQVFGIALTLCVGFILEYGSVFASNLTLTGFLMVGTSLTALIKSDLRRQRAHESIPCISPVSFDYYFNFTPSKQTNILQYIFK